MLDFLQEMPAVRPFFSWLYDFTPWKWELLCSAALSILAEFSRLNSSLGAPQFAFFFYSPAELGTKEDPLAAEVINPIVLKQREEIREKLAAAKEKRLLNQKLGYWCHQQPSLLLLRSHALATLGRNSFVLIKGIFRQ